MVSKVIPTLAEFRDSGDGPTVVRRRIPADLETPVSVFMKLRQRSDTQPTFLLESVERGIQVGRYSFIGVHPRATLTLRDDTVNIQRADGTESIRLDGSDPLNLLREEIDRGPASNAEVPGPIGGAVGFLSYEIGRYFEKLPIAQRDALGLPDFAFYIPRTVVAFDHVRSEIEIICQPSGNTDDDYHSAVGEIERLLDALSAPLEVRRGAVAHGAPPTSNFSQDRFEAMVREAKEQILAGEIFQIVLSQRLTGETKVDPFQVYRALRILNPSPYMFFLSFPTFQLIGSSPEVLVKLDKRRATVAPIAGTRPRGNTRHADDTLAEELLADEKERAEHVMLVDLGRNDLGRVCKVGSVQVDSLMHIERYSHVMHIVSTVTGTLRDELDAFDLLRAAFPAGTVSGAPKIRAMQLITQFEQDRRGPYAGSVGYFGRNGDMDMCITIRTILMQGERYHVQGGAGIVADSDPESEFHETLNKIRALTRAIANAEEGL